MLQLCTNGNGDGKHMMCVPEAAAVFIPVVKHKHLFHGDSFCQQGAHFPESGYQPVLMPDMQTGSNMDCFLSQIGCIGEHASLTLVRDSLLVSYPFIQHLLIGINYDFVIQLRHQFLVDDIALIIDDLQHFIF